MTKANEKAFQHMIEASLAGHGGYLTAAVTEAGVVRSPFSPGLAEAVRRAEAAAATIPACAADAAGRDARG